MRRWFAAALLVVFAFVYRFNALGGAFGGFDNDHFLHFIYAKQVQAGEQPLRDFLDAGLQGARPSLTYELSAAAQALFGNHLLPEAVLTAGLLAIASGVTFMAASAVAPMGWAILATVLAVLISPKLYSYPKVLMLAVASMLVVRYAARPSRAVLMVMAAAIAVAFLFRHDLAAYCAAGFVAVIACAHWHERREALWRVAVVGGIALILLAPSLLWIEWHAGLIPYFRNGLDMGADEMDRTAIGWPAFEAAGLLPPVSRANAEAWLYYLFLAMPLAALVVCTVRAWRGATPANPGPYVALAMITVSVWWTFLRGNLSARFGDMAPPVAVLGAVLLADATRRLSGAPPSIAMLRAGSAMLATALTVAAVWTVGSVRSELRTTGLSTSPRDVVRRASAVASELAALPAAYWTVPAPRAIENAARYLHLCTASSDRVLVMTYAPEVLAFADRRFAGGRATVKQNFYQDDRYDQYTLERLSAVPPAIVLVDQTIREPFSRLVETVERDYEHGGQMTFADGRVLDIYVPPSRVAGTYEDSAWPCLR